MLIGFLLHYTIIPHDSMMGRQLKKLYLDKGSPTFLAGSVDKLFKAYRANKFKPPITKKNVEDFLGKQKDYTIHRRGVEKFKRNRIHVKFIGDIVALDLIDFKSFSDDNDGFKYILCAIDCFSKKAYGHALKNKTPKECVKGFKEIMKNINFKIHNISVDNGGEFKAAFETYCRRQKINLYRVQGIMKNSIVERFILTFKTHLFRYIRIKGVHRWVDIMKHLIESYNKTYHRSIKMSPINVTDANSHTVYKTLFPDTHTRKPPKFHINDVVRFLKTFKKGIQKPYEGRWSLAVYRIGDIKYMPRGSIPMYHLKEVETGESFGDYWWYENELQKVSSKFADKKMEYDVTVLEQQGNKSLVKWLGYDNHKPSWIPTSQIVNIKT